MNRTLRILLAAVTFALVAAFLERFAEDLRSVIFECGKAAGCTYFQSGALLIGPDGPFMGGPHSGFFNFLWRHAPWISEYVIAFIPASIIFTATAPRRFPRDGLTRCGACGYILRGLSEPRCPECGVRI